MTGVPTTLATEFAPKQFASADAALTLVARGRLIDDIVTTPNSPDRNPGIGCNSPLSPSPTISSCRL
jgi:hypothetical protein